MDQRSQRCYEPDLMLFVGMSDCVESMNLKKQRMDVDSCPKRGKHVWDS